MIDMRCEKCGLISTTEELIKQCCKKCGNDNLSNTITYYDRCVFNFDSNNVFDKIVLGFKYNYKKNKMMCISTRNINKFINLKEIIYNSFKYKNMISEDNYFALINKINQLKLRHL